jgi:hypothetical protein
MGFEPDGRAFWITKDGKKHTEPTDEEGEQHVQPWILPAERYKQIRPALIAYVLAKNGSAPSEVPLESRE